MGFVWWKLLIRRLQNEKTQFYSLNVPLTPVIIYVVDKVHTTGSDLVCVDNFPVYNKGNDIKSQKDLH